MEESYTIRVCTNSIFVRWICVHCGKIMDCTNFIEFIREGDTDKNSNQQAVAEYHGWGLLPD